MSNHYVKYHSQTRMTSSKCTARNVKVERKLFGLMASPAAKGAQQLLGNRTRASLRSTGQYKGTAQQQAIRANLHSNQGRTRS